MEENENKEWLDLVSALGSARRDYLEAELNYDAASMLCRKVKKAHDKAGESYDKAQEAYLKAEEAYDAYLRLHDEIDEGEVNVE